MGKVATALPKPYHYPAPARVKKDVEVPRPSFGAEEAEQLVGTVQNKDASAPEERLAWALDNEDGIEGYNFRRIIIAPASAPGSMEVDFWVYRAGGRATLIKVDGDWIHSLPENVKKDKEDYDRLVTYCLKYGLEKPIVIKASRLQSKEMAQQTLRDVL